ncbi:MAG TPA: helix-turn-helix domain-containing protein [Vicinamibacterales bacterium]|nr:helix-turn-helix domain-containing protein [Vicinamibacterales bacterium]
MTGTPTGFDRRVQSALDATPSRIPVILGGCGTGRTSLLLRLRDRIGRSAAQYIDVERCATTPERFLAAVTSTSPFRWHGSDTVPTSAREAFDALLAFFDTARAPGGEPCAFLLDETLELRTFESFPGLRHVIRELVDALADSPNHFVLTTRYVARAHRLLRDATARFEVMHVTSLQPSDVTDVLAPVFGGYERMATDDRDYLGRAVQALTDGRVAYVKAIGREMAVHAGTSDPISALTALLSPDGALAQWCRFCYELRLHRARGYGALKAILDILAEEEGLTLTEISHRLRRTPGSTKDYLSWLEDVDLVVSRQKRYSFTDPLLRLWVRLHCHPVEPTEEDVVREVQHYALTRVPPREAVPALAYAGVEASPEERKSWGIIEID